MLRKIFLALFAPTVLFTFSTQAFALQTRTVVDNGSTTAQISSSEMTKIIVDEDFITDLYLSNSNIQTQINNETGELFLQPQSTLPKQSFTLMIRTHSGHSYTVVAMPVNTPAETILLMPAGSGSKKAERWETSSNYQTLLIRLLKSMAEGGQPDGYKVIHLDTKEKNYGKLGDIAYIKPLTIYKGKQIKGEVYQIINRTDQPINLTEREFYQIKDRGIALQEMTVAPHDSTILYKESDNA